MNIVCNKIIINITIIVNIMIIINIMIIMNKLNNLIILYKSIRNIEVNLLNIEISFKRNFYAKQHWLTQAIKNIILT